jgi:Ca2+-binding RTX toxin-like protein
MSKTLYYSIKFVTLHETKPSDFGVNLSIGNVTIPYVEKYRTPLGWQNENGIALPYFDYAEFVVAEATFDRNAYRSYNEPGGKATYPADAKGGGTTIETYAVWSSVSVPDDFVIPGDVMSPSPPPPPTPTDDGVGSDFREAWMDDARDTLVALYESEGYPARDLVTLINGHYSLFKDTAGHMQDQFKLMDRAWKGEISVGELNSQSDAAARDLIAQLAGSVIKVPDTVSIALSKLVTHYVDKPENRTVEVVISSGPIDAVGATLIRSLGGPGGTAFSDHAGVANIVVAGQGNDTVYGNTGNDTLLGGEGIDTIDYSAITEAGGITINLDDPSAFYEGTFFDHVVGFENVVGSQGSDRIHGSGVANSFSGGNGDDQMSGYAGRDTFVGGDGWDGFFGGEDIDTVIYDTPNGSAGIVVHMADQTLHLPGEPYEGPNTGEAAGDYFDGIENVISTERRDEVWGNELSNYLKSRGGNDSLKGLENNDVLNGGTGGDQLDGGTGIDIAIYIDATTAVRASLADQSVNRGEAKGDTYVSIEGLRGSKLGDQLFGDHRANYLDGYFGNDTLTGGSGRDFFDFRFSLGASGVDTITDFKHDRDTIRLDDAVFTAIGSSLSKSEFYARAGASEAHDTSDHIIYDTSTGRLYYDADALGGRAAIHFATLAGRPTLGVADFEMI